MAGPKVEPTDMQLKTSLRHAFDASSNATPEQRRALDYVAKQFVLSATAPSEVEHFRLLDLPPELRNRIYEYAVFLEKPLLPSVCFHQNRPTAVQPAVTRVCRQIRDESLPLFYGVNVFDFHVHRCDFDYFFEWMRNIGVQNRKCVQTVRFTLKNMWSCGPGLLDFVRWWATTDGIDKPTMQFDTQEWAEEQADDDNDDDDDEDIASSEAVLTKRSITGAVALGKRLRAERRTSEKQVRRAFRAWLAVVGMNCACSGLAYDSEPWLGLCSLLSRVVTERDRLARGCLKA